MSQQEKKKVFINYCKMPELDALHVAATGFDGFFFFF